MIRRLVALVAMILLVALLALLVWRVVQHHEDTESPRGDSEPSMVRLLDSSSILAAS